MTVRALRQADEPSVRALQATLAYSDPELLEAALAGPFLGLVGVSDGTVVGYAIGLPGRTTTLSELVVAPAHRRSGHGRALVDALAERATADAIVVTTPVTETPSRRFYTAIGFVVDERVPEFYADGADALRLVRHE